MTVTVLGYANAHGSRYFLLILNLALATLMVTKPMGWLSISLLTWQLLSLLEIFDLLSLSPSTPSSSPAAFDSNETATSSPPPTSISSLAPTLLALLAQHHFFKTGHTATLSSIQWDSAFTALHTLTYPASPLLILLNTFGPHLLLALALPLTILWKGAAKQHPKVFVNNVARAWAVWLMYWSVQSLGTAVGAGWLRRHLMLYRVFMPRFMLAQAVLLVVEVFGLVGISAAVWINTRSVVEVLGWA